MSAPLAGDRLDRAEAHARQRAQERYALLGEGERYMTEMQAQRIARALRHNRYGDYKL